MSATPRDEAERLCKQSGMGDLATARITHAEREMTMAAVMRLIALVRASDAAQMPLLWIQADDVTLLLHPQADTQMHSVRACKVQVRADFMPVYQRPAKIKFHCAACQTEMEFEVTRWRK
jgi:hypothetical protein